MATATETGAAAAAAATTTAIELSPEEQALLNTQFPAEIEKEAEAKLLALDAVCALRDYGAARAEEVLLSYGTEPVNEEEVLKKTAAAGDEIERFMKLVRANNYEEESQLDEKALTELLSKEAEASAHAINDGFWEEVQCAFEVNPELVKEAVKAGFAKKGLKMAGKVGHAAMGHASRMAGAAKKYALKHPGQAAGAAAAGGAAVGAAAHHAATK